jgi:rifampicin phosphotransferase
MAGNFVLGWADAATVGAEVVGGKGANLGRLDRYGFPVPVGGVLTADAYRLFMGNPQLRQLTSAFAEMSVDALLLPDVSERLAAVRQAIESTPLPDPVVIELRAFLHEGGLTQTPMAVRSSATAEDGAAASFAGIHHSYLGLTGEVAVIQGVVRCFASLWTPQAIVYRRRQGFSDDAVACAVVLCAMVREPGSEGPKMAGVAFTCDPRTGRRDVITINAAPGLGEGVVSGGVNPEEIQVSVAPLSLSVTSRQGRPEPVMTDAQALELARLTLRVYAALGDEQDPQDIEWAHDGERFWLVQARPVTRMPRWTFPGIAQAPLIWSNANTKDNYPGVMSPLNWSFVNQGIDQLLWAPFRAAGYEAMAGIELMRHFAGRPYFNLSAVQWVAYDAMGMLPHETNATVGGHQPEIPVPAGSPTQGPQGRRRQRARLRLALSLRSFQKRFSVDVAAFRALAREMAGLDLTCKSNAELMELVVSARQQFALFGPRFQLCNVAVGPLQSMLEGMLERHLPGRGRAVSAALMSGSGEVTSAEHGYRLFDLVTAARGDAAAEELLANLPDDPDAWRKLPGGSPFRAELERFLTDFGHRGVYEGEVANPRWAEDPTYILQQVRVLLASGELHQPQAAAIATRAAAEADVQRVPFLWRPIVRWLADKVRATYALREEGKSTIAALWVPLRRMVLEVGRRMAAEGHLVDGGDVFYLSDYDLRLYLIGEWSGRGARALVVDRRTQAERWAAEAPPDVIQIASDGSQVVRTRAMPAEGGGKVLRGIGVATGSAVGRARVISHPAEGHQLQPGEILVAPSTDPAWTPLFLRAAAVVTEVGGYLSHGAIVAREYGIPAVANLPGLMTQIRSGEELLINGDTGEVTRLS